MADTDLSPLKNPSRIIGRILTLTPYALDRTLTKEGVAAEAKAVGEALKRKISQADVADDLTTEDAGKPLSARQGTVLKKEIEDVSSRCTETLEGFGKRLSSAEEQGRKQDEQMNAMDSSLRDMKKGLGSAVAADGSTKMEKDLDLGGNKILYLATPEKETDAANKRYVDSRTACFTVTLRKDKWASYDDQAPYEQCIPLAGIQEKDNPHFGAVLSGTVLEKMDQVEAFSLVHELITGDGVLTFVCLADRPCVDLQVQLEVNQWGGGASSGEPDTPAEPEEPEEEDGTLKFQTDTGGMAALACIDGVDYGIANAGLTGEPAKNHYVFSIL